MKLAERVPSMMLNQKQCLLSHSIGFAAMGSWLMKETGPPLFSNAVLESCIAPERN